jgi:hypothetical protein
MITGLHAILYTEGADGTRAFLRDTLGLEPAVEAELAAQLNGQR